MSREKLPRNTARANPTQDAFQTQYKSNHPRVRRCGQEHPNTEPGIFIPTHNPTVKDGHTHDTNVQGQYCTCLPEHSLFSGYSDEGGSETFMEESLTDLLCLSEPEGREGGNENQLDTQQNRDDRPCQCRWSRWSAL